MLQVRSRFGGWDAVGHSGCQSAFFTVHRTSAHRCMLSPTDSSVVLRGASSAETWPFPSSGRSQEADADSSENHHTEFFNEKCDHRQSLILAESSAFPHARLIGVSVRKCATLKFRSCDSSVGASHAKLSWAHTAVVTAALCFGLTNQPAPLKKTSQLVRRFLKKNEQTKNLLRDFKALSSCLMMFLIFNGERRRDAGEMQAEVLKWKVLSWAAWQSGEVYYYYYYYN